MGDEFACAIQAAQNGRDFLEKNPVNQTWKIAADQLLDQYEEAIKRNENQRERHGAYSLFMAHLFRMILIIALAMVILSRYYIALKRVGNYAYQSTPLGLL